MDSHVRDPAETDDDTLTFDIPDDALERAGSIVGAGAMTIAYCTQDWVACGWPL